MTPDSNPIPASEDRAGRGHKTRERLLVVACEVFASKGFQSATTREICDAAQSNMAAIHYHFGDKAGLYRAVLLLPMQGFLAMTQGFDQIIGGFEVKIHALYSSLLEALRSRDPMFAQHMKLHFREMLEPTGAAEELLEVAFIPFFHRFAKLLSQELGKAHVDDDCYRLVFAMFGMAMDFYTSQQVSCKAAPNMADTPEKVSILIDRLSGYATGMLQFERERLARLNSSPPSKSKGQ